MNCASKIALRTCNLATSLVLASNLLSFIEIILANISSSSSSRVVAHWDNPGKKERPRLVAAAATAAFRLDIGVSPSVNETLLRFTGGPTPTPLLDADDVAEGDGVTAIGIGSGGGVTTGPSVLSCADAVFLELEELEADDAALESTSVEDLEELVSCVLINSFSMNDIAASIGDT